MAALWYISVVLQFSDKSTEGLWSRYILKLLSAMVSSANWEIGDQNYYHQFAELSWKNQNLLKAVRQSEVQLIGLLKSVWPRYFTRPPVLL